MGRKTKDEDLDLRDAGRRAPAGEGVSAPPSTETGDVPQMSIFDGAGNESVVVLAPGSDGRAAEGAGATKEDALKDARKGDTLLSDDFSPGKKGSTGH